MTDIAWGDLAPSAGARLLDRMRGAIAGPLIMLATVFTAVGASIISNRVIQAGTAPKDLGWGTGTTAATTADTDLQTEASETLSAGRVVCTEARTTVTNTNDNNTWTGTVTAAGTKAITESALFDAQSSGATVPNAHGNLLMHAVFSAINVNAADSIAFTHGLKYVPN